VFLEFLQAVDLEVGFPKLLEGAGILSALVGGTCQACAPHWTLLIYNESVLRPRNCEVHRDLQSLIGVDDLTHFPDGEGVVDVHPVQLLLILQEEERRFFSLVVLWQTPGRRVTIFLLLLRRGVVAEEAGTLLGRKVDEAKEKRPTPHFPQLTLI